MTILTKDDGSWQSLYEQWRNQCDKDEFEIYCEGTFSFLEKLIESPEPKADVLCAGAGDTPSIICQVNTARTKGYVGAVLRVRHLVTSPHYDLDDIPISEYAKTLVDLFFKVYDLSNKSGTYKAKHIKFHLRSPSEQDFFATLGEGLSRTEHIKEVRLQGAWLYVTKV